MPPRLDMLFELFAGLRVQHATVRPLSSTSSRATSTVTQKRRRQDPYAATQAKARRAANISRQEVLRVERAKAYGDPVRGVPTPFLKSFDTAEPMPEEKERTRHLNHFVTDPELQTSIQTSNLLTTPLSSDSRGSSDPQVRELEVRDQQREHENARLALERIASLENSSSKDKLRINTQRCIEYFGRHQTDQYLRPKPPSTSPRPEGYVPNEKTPRAGPDTGSSEVQIAILTAKIRTLADFLELRGKKDKHNKRNLTLLVHRRQKLLRYLRKKERGGERWQHLINTLGLTEGTWQGEIALK